VKPKEWLRAVNPLWHLYARVALSRAKHRSLAGHPRMALRLSRWLKGYGFGPGELCAADGAPADVTERRDRALARLSAQIRARCPQALALTEQHEENLSDLAFVSRNRVPFPFQEEIARQLRVPVFVRASEGVRLQDLDGNWSYDLGGSYGVNLFGNELYKQCIERGVARMRDLGVVLGPYHPLVADNVARLKALSGLDEVSFHMSGTEAVMQAVRLARYHSKRSHVVRFCGAYHGWWDGVQAGPGNPVPARGAYTLAEMSERTLKVLRMRDDIACVLVNPIQALAPNASPASDSALLTGERRAHYDKARYARWLQQLREVCSERGIALVFDEVFVGFRLAKGGAQEYFGVSADLVTYGKSVGGGLPVGVLCGRHEWMRRFHPDRPADICFARGTFNTHPYVMATMNELLCYLDTPQAAATWNELDRRWDNRAATLNCMLGLAQLPFQVANLASTFTTLFQRPGRYHWMLQYYLRAQGLSLAWIGSGRFIFSHDYTDADFNEVAERIVAAGKAMAGDGWFWRDETADPGALKRRVFRELLQALLRRHRSHAAHPHASAAAGSAVASTTHKAA
jgi:glutamate-1-semialdehyde 2,1-aminomutase